ncbi:MAG: HAMP domain-containing sensor histidine kinase, partial [Bacteroidales bacterium]|nr:HAMP domain-containing sensor histidine kinase [Bacteroidales bacterium]
LVENFSLFDNQQIVEQIEIIHKTVHKTYSLLEDLLLWSRSQLGRIEFQPTNLLLETICKEVVLSLAELADKKNIRLDIGMSSDLRVLADENMLKTILRNLITNAIKFSFHDSVVTISAKPDHQMVGISVFDQGVGISLSRQEKIWKLSEQFSTEGTDKEEGSGLGLLLCKEFTEKQGGTISVLSEPDKGSEFCFTVPKGE